MWRLPVTRLAPNDGSATQFIARNPQGKSMDPVSDAVVNDREELIYLLTEAAEFEHSVMCTLPVSARMQSAESFSTSYPFTRTYGRSAVFIDIRLLIAAAYHAALLSAVRRARNPSMLRGQWCSSTSVIAPSR